MEKLKEIELLKKKISFTCWCINTIEAIKYIDVIEKELERLYEIEFRMEGLDK